MNLKQAYSYAVQFLELNNVDEADFKALCLVCHLAGIKNSEYSLHIDDEIIMSRLAKSLWRLKEGEPLQYVLGKWDFYESEFYVGKGVLIPRPETEELVEKVIDYAKNLINPVIYDLCSGSGCIGISIAKAVPGAVVYCIEKATTLFIILKKTQKACPMSISFTAILTIRSILSRLILSCQILLILKAAIFRHFKARFCLSLKWHLTAALTDLIFTE